MSNTKIICTTDNKPLDPQDKAELERYERFRVWRHNLPEYAYYKGEYDNQNVLYLSPGVTENLMGHLHKYYETAKSLEKRMGVLKCIVMDEYQAFIYWSLFKRAGQEFEPEPNMYYQAAPIKIAIPRDSEDDL